MDNRPDGAAIVAGIASLIADRDMSTYRWGAVTDEEKAQVPIYWVGEPSRTAAFGALPKSAGPPTIRRLEQWLKHIGATPAAARRGKGSHRRWTLPNRQPLVMRPAPGSCSRMRPGTLHSRWGSRATNSSSGSRR
jgi:hypothetical protein